MIQKKLYIASDHAGFALKEFLIQKLSPVITIIDLGCNSATESVDYPDYAKKLAKKIKSPQEFGILVCGSGIGISIAANRFSHIRAALCLNVKSAKLARAHNDANVICLGERLMSQKTAFAAVKAFLNSDFEKGRHVRRVEKLGK